MAADDLPRLAAQRRAVLYPLILERAKAPDGFKRYAELDRDQNRAAGEGNYLQAALLTTEMCDVARSQFGENSIFSRVPPDLRGEFFGTEQFYQARPEWPEGAEPERGIDGL